MGSAKNVESLLRSSLASIGFMPTRHVLLAMGIAVVWGVNFVVIHVGLADFPPLPLAGLSLALGEGSPSIGVGGVLAVLYVVVGATFFGFGSWAWLLRRHPASRVVPFALLVPVAGIASAWVALGEQPNTPELVGAGVVLTGLAVATSAVTASGGRSRLRKWLPLFRSRPSVSVQTSSQR